MPGRDLNLLALDGGGVRGLSSLKILKELMERVADANGLDVPPKPCNYFDMIGGTSTGGLIAIMLGRLRMTVDECIDAYMSISDRVFQKQRHRINIQGKIQGRFDSDALEDSIKRIITRSGKLSEDELLRDVPNAPCKVFVCAMSKRTKDIVPLASYRRPRGGNDRLQHVKIWEAARATSAASTFFDEISVSMGNYTEVFLDGATGANNPVRVLWNEAKDYWEPEPLERNLSALISIGTGVPSINAFDDSLCNTAHSLVRISTETGATAESFIREHSLLHDEKRYFRFNVANGLESVGLEDATQKDMIMLMTGRYLELHDVHLSLRSCVQALKGREPSKNFGPEITSKDSARNKELQKRSKKTVLVRQRSAEAPKVWGQIVDSISTYAHHRNHRKISRGRRHGTGGWFLQRSEVHDWLGAAEAASLWCYAKVGFGKTVLASAVVEATRDHAGTKGNFLGWYYCADTLPALPKAIEILESFIKQQLLYLNATAKPFPDEIRSTIIDVYYTNRRERDFDEVSDLFTSLFEAVGTAHYVLDGFDILDDIEISNLFDVLRRTFEKDQRSRILLFSRKEIHRNINITQLFRGMKSVSLSEADNRDDIATYVKEKLAEKSTYARQLTENEELMRFVATKLASRAEGMMLWVYLKIEELWETTDSDQSVKSCLEDFPERLEDIYSRCLNRIRKQNNSEMASKVFQWIACASRALHVEELKEAVAFNEYDRRWEDGRVCSDKVLIGSCANLAFIDPSDLHVSFTHPSVLQYLVDLTESEFQIDQKRGKLACGAFSINYLNFDNFQLQLQTQSTSATRMPMNIGSAVAQQVNPSFGPLVERLRSPFGRKSSMKTSNLMLRRLVNPPQSQDVSKFKFLAYATKHWVIDCREITREDPLWESFVQLTLTRTTPYGFHPWEDGNISAISYLHSMMGWAVRNDHIPLLELIMAQEPKRMAPSFFDLPLVAESDGDQSRPLHVAVKLELAKMTETLLTVANPDAKDAYGRTPLHLAALKSDIFFTQKLLEAGADIGVRNDEDATPLYVAASSGHADVVRELLVRRKYIEKDATVLNDGGTRRTALEAAATAGNDTVAAMLVNAGAKADVEVDILHRIAIHGMPETLDAIAMSWRGEVFGVAWPVFPDSVPVIRVENALILSKSREKRLNILHEALKRDKWIHGLNFIFFFAILQRHVSLTAYMISRLRHLDNNFLWVGGILALEDVNEDILATISSARAGICDRWGFEPQETWLTLSTWRGDSDAMRILLRLGANPNTPNGYGEYPLQLAFARALGQPVEKRSELSGIYHSSTRYRHFQPVSSPTKGHNSHSGIPDVFSMVPKEDGMINLLLDHGADYTIILKKVGMNPSIRDENGQALLHHAVRHGSQAITSLLLKVDEMNPNIKDDDGQTALHIAACKENPSVISTLLKSPSINRSVKDMDGRTPLHHAVACGKVHNAVLLMEDNFSIDTLDDKGRTPLHLAAYVGSVKIVEQLISAGARVNRWDSRGYTPLHLSACCSLSLGSGEFPAERPFALPFRISDHGGQFIRMGMPRDTAHLLVCNGGVIDARTLDGLTPLHIAAYENDLRLLQYFIEKGARRDFRDFKKNTVMHYAVSGLAVDVIRWLIQEGVQVNSKNTKGETPLSHAVWIYSQLGDGMQVIRELCAHGAWLCLTPSEKHSIITQAVWLFVHEEKKLVELLAYLVPQERDPREFARLEECAVEALVQTNAWNKSRVKSTISSVFHNSR